MSLNRRSILLLFLCGFVGCSIGCAQLKCKATLKMTPDAKGIVKDIQEQQSLVEPLTMAKESAVKNGFWLYPGFKCSFVELAPFKPNPKSDD